MRQSHGVESVLPGLCRRAQFMRDRILALGTHPADRVRDKRCSRLGPVEATGVKRGSQDWLAQRSDAPHELNGLGTRNVGRSKASGGNRLCIQFQSKIVERRNGRCR